MGWSACGLFWANRHHLELNWTELFAIHQILYERPSQWIWSMDWETTFYYISLKLYSSLLYMFRQTFFFFFFLNGTADINHRNIPQSEVAKYQTGTYNSLGCEPLPVGVWTYQFGEGTYYYHMHSVGWAHTPVWHGNIPNTWNMNTPQAGWQNTKCMK